MYQVSIIILAEKSASLPTTKRWRLGELRNKGLNSYVLQDIYNHYDIRVSLRIIKETKLGQDRDRQSP